MPSGFHPAFGGGLTRILKKKQHILILKLNGSRFDIPFIEHEFPGFFNHLYIDLLYPLKKIGYSGGLKRIEDLLGINRSKETASLTGFDAVRLWNRYEQRNDESLDLLVKYNKEETEMKLGLNP